MITGNEPINCFEYVVSHEFGGDERTVHTGITIRQHFAAMAMQGVINSYADGTKGNLPSGKIVAEYAVAYADGLIKELNKT